MKFFFTAPLFRSGKSAILRSPATYIFLGVLAVRLVVLTRLTGSPFLLPSRGDMHFYNDWALRILHGQWTDHQAFYGLPLYAYLLAALYWCFGYSPFVPGFIQCCFEAGTAVIIYRLACVIFGEGSANNSRGKIIGLTAAIGWAAYQPAAAYSVILMPAAGVVFVFWFVVWQIVKRPALPPLHGWLLLGALVGFTAMGVATILFLIPLLLLALVTRWPGTFKEVVSGKENNRNHILTRVVAMILLFLGIALGMAPSWVHNYFIAHEPVVLSAHSGVNFWIGNNPSATGYPRFPPGLHAGQEAMLRDSIAAAEREAGHALKRSEVSAYWSRKASAYIHDHFRDWLRLLALKIANFWNAFQYDDLSIITMLREGGVLFPGLRFGLIAALGLPGLFLAWRKFPLSCWVTGAVLLQMASLLTVFVTERYRLAAVPGLLLFATFGLYELGRACAFLQLRTGATYLGLLTLGTLFVSMPKRDPALWTLDSYNSGLQALETGRLKEAEKRLMFAYAYVPGNAELNFALGNLRLAQGDKEQALAYYYATLRLDPKHEGSYNNLGVLALEGQRWNLAAKFLTKALEQDPADAKTHYLLARSYLGSGNLKAADAEIARAIKLNPKPAEFLALQQEIRRRSGSAP